jgi:hypothetical protein
MCNKNINIPNILQKISLLVFYIAVFNLLSGCIMLAARGLDLFSPDTPVDTNAPALDQADTGIM